MFAGHFGVAAAVKSKTPELPLWSLIVSSQLLDIAYIPFSLAGIERMEPVGDGGYGNVMIYAFYSHSLVGALLLALLAAGLAGNSGERKQRRLQALLYLVIGYLTSSSIDQICQFSQEI